MSQALRKLAGTISRSNTTAIFINQMREKIGVMFGNPETTPGGRALKFYASVRLDIRRIETIKEGNEVIGNRVRVKVVKNKVAPPFRQAEFDVMFGGGISREGSLLDVAVDYDVVRKSGAWYTYDGDQLGQGRENAKRFLRENPEVAVQLQARVLAAVGLAASRRAPRSVGCRGTAGSSAGGRGRRRLRGRLSGSAGPAGPSPLGMGRGYHVRHNAHTTGPMPRTKPNCDREPGPETRGGFRLGESRPTEAWLCVRRTLDRVRRCVFRAPEEGT